MYRCMIPAYRGMHVHKSTSQKETNAQNGALNVAEHRIPVYQHKVDTPGVGANPAWAQQLGDLHGPTATVLQHGAQLCRSASRPGRHGSSRSVAPRG